MCSILSIQLKIDTFLSAIYEVIALSPINFIENYFVGMTKNGRTYS